MKRILALVLGLFVAQTNASMIPILAGPPPAPILFQDALTYADAAAAASAGWTNAGTVGWGNTAGPGSFSGSAALRSAGATSNNTRSASFAGHGGGTVYVYLKEWAIATNAVEQDCISFRTSGDTAFFKLTARQTGVDTLRVIDSVGGGVSASSNTYVVNTVYQLKVAYTPGTGANGVITVWLGDGSTWTQYVNRTTSDATSLLGKVLFISASSCSNYARGLYVSTADYTPAQLAALP